MFGGLRNVPRHEFRAAALAIGVSVLLLAIKFVAYYLTGSAAVFSDALESIVNVAASAFAGYSLFLAHQPADAQHPYGHGKIEFVSAGFEGGMILLAAFMSFARAVEATLHGARVEALEIGLSLMALAGCGNGGRRVYLIPAGAKPRAGTPRAGGKHLPSHAITSAARPPGALASAVEGGEDDDTP